MIVLHLGPELMVQIVEGGRNADYTTRNERNQMDRDGLDDLGSDNEQRDDMMVRVGMGRDGKGQGLF